MNRQISKEREGHGGVMTMARPMEHWTFAEMMKEAIDPRMVKELRIELPWWALFPPIQERRDQDQLSDVERERFLCAFNTLNANGTLGSIVDIHADPSHQMHGTERFLPWHRIYLRQLELALQSIHPDVTIPYWDWTDPSEQAIPSWLVGVTPTVVTPTRTITVIRSPGTQTDLATLASNVPGVESQTTFSNFTFQLEVFVHNGIHVWVGGAMGSVPTAPADPLFWMHHCNIDRLWWQWQQSTQGQGKNPNLTGSAAVMDPWAYTEADTRDIGVLGYTYV